MAALLAACRPLSPASLAAIRVACTMASDNVLLQQLFRLIPPLSHISTRDALLLGPANEEDRVDVEENGMGQDRRMWILTFSAVVETTPDGRTENRWYLSLELEEHSPPTAVNANLVILGSSDAAEEGDSIDLVRSIPLCPPMSELSPGHDKAIKIRLDDGPMGPYLLNESSLLVDSNKALHARLTQSTVPVLIADTSSGSSHSLELYTPISDITSSFIAGSPQPQPGRKKKKKRQKEVHVTLRRGGR
ncbi:hypothetical protein BJV77DRAFT_1071580 [Russula vinacea]|nr:hypothetical protein BJV77DRAFT_1071580 [Russula vinacea]